MKEKKKKPRRNNVKNPSLIKRYNSRIRQEYIDLDYINKLDNKNKNCKLPNGKMVTELEYIDFFMKEWNNGEVSKQSEAKKNKFHRTAKEVKDCTDRNNSRNRDLYGQQKAHGLVNLAPKTELTQMIETVTYQHNGVNIVEDAIIELIDETKKISKSSKNRNKNTNNTK